MAKRPLPSNFFALPGLSKPHLKKPHGSPSSTKGYFSDSPRRFIPSKDVEISTKDNLTPSPSLVDDKGSLLPPQTKHTLGNLTKSRPRNPRRRSPSPLTRRKFEHDSGSVGPADLSASRSEKEISKKGYKGDQGALINALEERTAFSTSFVLENDVGITSHELSVERCSPKFAKANPPKVPAKPERNRIRGNAQDERRIYDLDNGKIDEVESTGNEDITVEPPPLPTSPPPLDEEGSSKLDDQTFAKESTFLLQEALPRNATKVDDESKFDYNLSTKLGTNREPTSQVTEFSIVEQYSSNDGVPSVPVKDSATSRTAKGHVYGHTFSEYNQRFRSPRVGDSIQDKPLSLDSAITLRLSKYEAPYSSRQCKQADKTLSSRRRRFKPVSLPNEADTMNSMIPAEICETTDCVAGEGQSHTFSESSCGDYLPNDGVQKIDMRAEDSSPKKVRMEGGNQKKDTALVDYISNRLHVSQTTNPEPLVTLQYDISNNTEKAIEIQNKETKPTVVSETRHSNRTAVKESNSQSSIVKNDGDDTKSNNEDSVSNLFAKHLDSSGMTLPKVVIEYDGEVFSDPMVHEYDTKASGEGVISTGVQAKSITQGTDSESDISLRDDSDDVAYYGEFSEEEDLDLGLDDVSLGDEDLTFEDLDSAREEMEREKGIEDPGLNVDDHDGLTNQSSIQDDNEMSESDIEETDEMLLQPPPMFASSVEVETDNLEEVHTMENGYECNATSPVVPSSLLEQQPRDDKRFHNLALEVWTEEDCVDWLDYIGLGHFTPEFKEHHVDGKMLKNINFQLLEEIGIDSPDEREVILSEIYRRFHPEEEDMFEMEIQGALQSASEQERMKIMAVLNALRSPAFQAELGLTHSTGPSSPHDSYASESGSISSGMTGGSDEHHDLAMPSPPPPPNWSQAGHNIWKENNALETKSKGGKSKKHRKLSKDSDKSSEKEKKNDKHGQKQKKHKGVSKLLDSLSLSSGSSKLTKLFQHHSSSSSTLPAKKLNPTMQYLLQAGPQGLIRIWPIALSEEMNYCSFMVNMTTTSAEIIKLVFEKYEVVDDPRRFYVCETSLGKGGSHQDLLDSDCPLFFQCRWQDPDKRRFELRCKNEGVIKMLFELEGYEDDLDYRSIPLSTKTPCSEALPLIVKKFNLPGEASEYFLVEVSEENEDDREEVAGHVCPLRLQMAWNAPDHVFRLCRRAADGGNDEDSKDIMLDGWTTDATEDAAHEPGIQSELSSAAEEDDLDMAPAILGTGERDEIVEETSEDLMEGLARLDSVIEEESEAIASQELQKLKRQLSEKEVELRDLRLKTEVLKEKDSEIERLMDENGELRRTAEDLNKLRLEKEDLEKENEELRRLVLTVKESELHELRLRNEKLCKEAQGIEERFKDEISLRDREIERLYARNNELSFKEKELESLNERNVSLLAFEAQQKELEKLRLFRDEVSASQRDMTSKLKSLQEKNMELEIEVSQAENLVQINRELCRKADEGEILRQEFERTNNEKKELNDKLEDLIHEKTESERINTAEVEKLREKNLVLMVQCKDADEMKNNIIKLTAQLRDMERENQYEADNVQRRLDELTAEKKLLQERIAELEKNQNSEEQKDISGKEGEDLKLENIFLVERTKEIEDLRASVAKLSAEVRENESFKQKYKELRDVESYLTKQINTTETIARQKDKKLKESENKINTLTEAVKDMEAKLEEQEQNQHYLDQLLTMLKDRDPTLLHVINSSLASNEPEEWC